MRFSSGREVADLLVEGVAIPYEWVLFYVGRMKLKAGIEGDLVEGLERLGFN